MHDMKKTLFAAALAALLPLLASCTKEGEPRFGEPRFLRYAGQLLLKSGTVTKAQDGDDASAGLVSIELTESGIYAVGERAEGSDEVLYTSGSYTVSGDSYSLAGFGTIAFDNGSAGDVILSVDPDGAPAYTASATLRKASDTNRAYRGWTVDKTRVSVRSWIPVSADFTGCNLYEIAGFLRENGHDAPDDLAPGLRLATVSFTGTETIIFSYSDGTADVGEFSLTGSNFTYGWNGSSRKFTFLTDQAQIEYMDGKCILTISARIENSSTSGTVSFVLSPME